MGQQYIRHRTFTLNEGFEIIQSGVNPMKIDGFDCSTDSIRLRSFLINGPQCAHPGCSLVGSFFAMERDSKGSKIIRFHLNLYAINPQNGTEVMMTHDHITARSHGGADHESNTQTMCFPHNVEKGKEEQRLLLALQHRELSPVEQLERRFQRQLRRQSSQGTKASGI